MQKGKKKTGSTDFLKVNFYKNYIYIEVLNVHLSEFAQSEPTHVTTIIPLNREEH